MKLVINKKELLEALGEAGKAVNKSSETVEQCFYIQASLDKVIISASNLELYIEKVLNGIDIEESGDVLVNAVLFQNVIKKTGADEIVLITKEKKVIVSGKGTKTKTVVSALDNLGPFPNPPGEVDDNFNETSIISGQTLNDMVRRIIFIGDEREDAAKLNAKASFIISCNSMKLSVVDNYRVGIRKTTVRDCEDFSVSIQLSVLRLISDTLKNFPEVSMKHNEKHMMFYDSSLKMYARLVDGTPFDPEVSLAKSLVFDNSMKINRLQLVETLERGLLFMKASDTKRFFLETKGNVVNAYLEKTTTGEVSDMIPVVKSKEEIKIAFNPKFALEVLKALTDEEVTIYYTNHKAPLIMKDANGSYLYLIMPVNY